MAKVFGILTAVILALAAFVAFKNNARSSSAVAKIIVERGILSDKEIKLAEAQKVLAALPIEIGKVDAEVDGLVAQEAKTSATNDEIKGQIDEKTQTFAANKQKLDEIRELSQKSGDLKGLAGTLRATKAELEELSTSVSSAEAKLADMTAQHAAAASQAATARTSLENFASGQSLPAMETRIRSIYPSWGFVTLAGGNNVGVVADSALNVIRNGQTIAMLLVTAVESNSASASIIPDSLEDDVTLMVGDQVVPGIKPKVGK